MGRRFGVRERPLIAGGTQASGRAVDEREARTFVGSRHHGQCAPGLGAAFDGADRKGACLAKLSMEMSDFSSGPDIALSTAGRLPDRILVKDCKAGHRSRFVKIPTQPCPAPRRTDPSTAVPLDRAQRSAVGGGCIADMIEPQCGAGGGRSGNRRDWS